MGPGRCSSTTRSINGLGTTCILPASARPSEHASVTGIHSFVRELFLEEGESQYTRTKTLNTSKGCILIDFSFPQHRGLSHIPKSRKRCSEGSIKGKISKKNFQNIEAAGSRQVLREGRGKHGEASSVCFCCLLIKRTPHSQCVVNCT